MSIFGGTFKPFVIKQITARQALMSQGVNTPGGKRSRNVQLYTAAKSSWVKMASFVDYSSDPGVASNDSLARKYVLMGGTLWNNPENNLRTDLKYGVDTPREKGAYTSTDGFGHKLMPGITAISINNEGAYGSLRSATISYKCWTKQQLDDLEILYMRAGYPVLLEWGWSMYIDTATKEDTDYKRKSNRGDLNVNSTDLAKFIEKPLQSWNGTTINPFDPNKTLETLYDDIERLQAKYSGNYDGMVGIVKNFSYKIETDGSYTCTTNLISMGDALASIKMNKPSKEQQAFEDLVTGYKTSFTDMMSKIAVGVVGQGSSRTAKPSEFKAPASLANIPGIDISRVSLQKFVNSPYGNDTFPTYIQFAFLIALININFNTYLDGAPLVEVELPIYKREGNIGNGLCLASLDTVSIDPAVCIIKNSEAKWITNNNKEGYYPGSSIGARFEEFLIKEDASQFHNLGQIGNIYVCVQYVTKVFNDIMSNRESGDVGIYPFLKELLNGMSYALGGVNNFDLYTTDSKAVIIDKNYTELPSKSKADSKFQLNIFGIDSIVRDFKIESKIFQSQSNLMAIGAGGQMNLGGVNSSTQNYFNRGLRNRLYPEEPTVNPVEANKKATDERVEEAGNVLQLTKYIKDFTDNFTFPVVGEAVASANTYLKHILLRVNNDVNFRAIIPINVEITLDGISGIAIGEVFRLNTDMLPTDYNRKDIGFIASKLSHSITNSSWTTTLGAYVILLDQAKDDKGNRLNVLSSSKKAEIVGYQELFKARQQDKLNDYYEAYVRILKFLAEYFAGNVIVKLDKKNTVENLTLTPGITTSLNRLTPDYKLFVKKPLYAVVGNYSVFRSELGTSPQNTTSIFTSYNVTPTPTEEAVGYTGLLDTIKRNNSEKEALKKAKDLIKAELNKLADYKDLTAKAKPLADDIIRVIDKIALISDTKVEYRRDSLAADGNRVIDNSVRPIQPKLQPNGVDVIYNIRSEKPSDTITLNYNNKVLIDVDEDTKIDPSLANKLTSTVNAQLGPINQ